MGAGRETASKGRYALGSRGTSLRHDRPYDELSG